MLLHIVFSLSLYFGSLAFPFCLSFLSKGAKERNRRKLICISAYLVFALISGLRSPSVGVDTQQFVSSFLAIGKSHFPFTEFRFEIGYSCLCYLIYQIYPNSQFFLLITSLLINFGVFLFIYFCSEEPLPSIFCYISSSTFFMNMNTMRQSLALSIFLIGFVLFQKKNTLLFIIFILFAGLFHKVFLLSIVIIPLVKMEKRREILLFLLSLGILIFLLGDSIIALVALTPFGNYIGSSFWEAAPLGGVFNLIFPMLCALFLFKQFNFAPVYIFPYYLPKRRGYVILKQEQYSPPKTMLFSSGIACLILVIFFDLLTIRWQIFTRVVFVFSPLFYLLLPNIFRYINVPISTRRFLYVVLLLTCLITALFRPNWTGVFNYSFGF